jgi:Tfp pilus assembly protein PilF
MASISAKSLFREARQSEEKGELSAAAEKYVKLGKHLIRKAKYEQARTILTRAIALYPPSPRYLVYLSVAESHLGTKNKAKLAMRQAALSALRDKKVERYAAFLDHELASYPTLKRYFYETVLELDRTDARPFLALARIATSEKNFEGAKKHLLDALETKTADEKIVPQLERVLEFLARPDGLEHLQRFQLGQLKRKDLIELLTAEPPSVPVLHVAPSPEKDLRALIADLESDLGIAVGDGYQNVDVLVKEFRKKANVVLGADAKANIDMAMAFFEMGLTKDAQDQLKRIPTQDPLYWEAQCLLGQVLVSEGSDLGALEIFQRCLRTEGGNSDLINEVRYKLIEIYLRLEDTAQAFVHLRALEKKVPNYRNLKSLKALLNEMGTQLPVVVVRRDSR